jgi:hypothetical protein
MGSGPNVAFQREYYENIPSSVSTLSGVVHKSYSLKSPFYPKLWVSEIAFRDVEAITKALIHTPVV